MFSLGTYIHVINIDCFFFICLIDWWNRICRCVIISVTILLFPFSEMSFVMYSMTFCVVENYMILENLLEQLSLKFWWSSHVMVSGLWHQCLGGTYHLHLLDRRWKQYFSLRHWSLPIGLLCHNAEDHNMYLHHHKTLNQVLYWSIDTLTVSSIWLHWFAWFQLTWS
jgi:hypothetical protein